MRPPSVFALLAVLALGPAAASAQNVSAEDLVKLTAAGLNDDVLIALIESDRAVFKLTADDVLSLRDRGLSQKVIVAMLQTARRPPAVEDAPAAPLPSHAVAATTEEPPVPPVVVNVTQQVEQRVEQPRERERSYRSQTYVPYPVAVPVYIAPRPPEKKPEPVYWGFGGQRRPDTWKEKEKDE